MHLAFQVLDLAAGAVVASLGSLNLGLQCLVRALCARQVLLKASKLVPQGLDLSASAAALVLLGRTLCPLDRCIALGNDGRELAFSLPLQLFPVLKRLLLSPSGVLQFLVSGFEIPRRRISGIASTLLRLLEGLNAAAQLLDGPVALAEGALQLLCAILRLLTKLRVKLALVLSSIPGFQVEKASLISLLLQDLLARLGRPLCILRSLLCCRELLVQAFALRHEIQHPALGLLVEETLGDQGSLLGLKIFLHGQELLVSSLAIGKLLGEVLVRAVELCLPSFQEVLLVLQLHVDGRGGRILSLFTSRSQVFVRLSEASFQMLDLCLLVPLVASQTLQALLHEQDPVGQRRVVFVEVAVPHVPVGVVDKGGQGRRRRRSRRGRRCREGDKAIPQHDQQAEEEEKPGEGDQKDDEALRSGIRRQRSHSGRRQVQKPLLQLQQAGEKDGKDRRRVHVCLALV